MKSASSPQVQAKWYPDLEYIQKFKGPVLYPDEVTSKWALPAWSGEKAPTEKSVKNIILNFGPQHPAAHGVLRLVLELDGEVIWIWHSFLIMKQVVDIKWLVTFYFLLVVYLFWTYRIWFHDNILFQFFTYQRIHMYLNKFTRYILLLSNCGIPSWFNFIWVS